MKKLLLSAAVLLSAFTFTGCYDAIFQSIRKEVPLNEGNIAGFINKVVRVGSGSSEYIFTQNGNLYSKKIPVTDEEAANLHQYGKWNKVSAAFDGQTTDISYDYFSMKFNGIHIYNIASDENYLYAIGYEPVQDDEEGVNTPKVIKLFCINKSQIPENINNSDSWKPVTEVNTKIAEYLTALETDKWNYSSYYLKNISICLFCTEDKNTESNREAYIRIAGGTGKLAGDTTTSYNYWDGAANANYSVYKLNGESTSSTPAYTGTASETKVPFTQPSVDTVSAVKYKGTTYFFDNLASGKYESFDSDGNGTDQFMYYCSGQMLYWTKDGTFADGTDGEKSTLDTQVGYTIISSCQTADSILLGTQSGGVYRILVSGNVPATSKTTFDTNADSIMVSPYIVRTLFCEDPAKTEIEATLYSSMDFIYTSSSAGTSMENRCLWSYYPNRDDTTETYHWNRE